MAGEAHNRPAPKAMPAADFKNDIIAEFGEGAELNAQDLADLNVRSGEPDDNASIEQIVSREAISFGKKDPDPEDDEPSGEPENFRQEPQIDEQMRIHQEMMNAQARTFEKALDQAMSKYETPKAPEPKYETEPEYMQYSDEQVAELAREYPYEAQVLMLQRQGYRQEQQLKYFAAREVSRDHSQINKQFDDAYAGLQAKYPGVDIKKYISPELMEKAKEQTRAARKVDADISGWMNQVLWAQYGPELYSGKSQASPNEVAAQRAKKMQSSKTMNALSSGGGTYQPPQKSSNTDKTMRGGREGFLADLKAEGLY